MAKFKSISKNRINNLPKAVGVYAFKDKKQKFLYIGKAVNIRSRVKNHFQQPIFKDSLFIGQTNKIGYIKTNSEIEALLLEAELIKKYQPKYNVQWKDNKNYFFVVVSKEDFPRVFMTHQPNTMKRFKIYDSRFKNKKNPESLFLNHKSFFLGPFVDGQALKKTLRILRKIFPYRTCKNLARKACLYQELGLCLAPCLYNVKNVKCQNLNVKSKCKMSKLKKVKKTHQQNVRNIIKILRGRRKQVLNELKREMKTASQEQDYEKAGGLRDKIYALENVFSHSHILEGV